MSHRGFLFQLAFYSVCILAHHFSIGRHSLAIHFLYLPSCLSPSCQTRCSSQVPHRPRQRAGMPIASSHPPLRGADATALLPGDSLAHINTSTGWYYSSCPPSIQVMKPVRGGHLCFCGGSIVDNKLYCSLAFICCCLHILSCKISGGAFTSAWIDNGKCPPLCLCKGPLEFIITRDFACLSWECVRFRCYSLCSKGSRLEVTFRTPSESEFIFGHGADDEPQVESIAGRMSNRSHEHHICGVMSRAACQQRACRCVIYDRNPGNPAAFSVR